MIDQNAHQLIQKHLDGLTSDSEAELLSEKIVSDPEFRIQYLQAASLHAALADESLILTDELNEEENDGIIPCPLPSPTQVNKEEKTLRPLSFLNARPLQVAAALTLGLFIGLSGLGVVRAINKPSSETSPIAITHGNFDQLETGKLPFGFPKTIGKWSGDPTEVVELDGNKMLRFIETANVKGNPGGFATACNLFQIIDLSSIKRANGDSSSTQMTLELSSKFQRKASPDDALLPNPNASVTIHLYDSDPESLGEYWPEVISEAVAIGHKKIKLAPGDGPAKISASCLLAPEAKIALISVNVKSGTKSPVRTPVGGFYVDDVKLSLTKQPKLPSQK